MAEFGTNMAQLIREEARKIQEKLALDEAEKRRICQIRKQRAESKKKEKRTKT